MRESAWMGGGEVGCIWACLRFLRLYACVCLCVGVWVCGRPTSQLCWLCYVCKNATLFAHAAVFAVLSCSVLCPVGPSCCCCCCCVCLSCSFFHVVSRTWHFRQLGTVSKAAGQPVATRHLCGLSVNWEFFTIRNFPDLKYLSFYSRKTPTTTLPMTACLIRLWSN